MLQWATTHRHEVKGVTAAAVWRAAYADVNAWPKWNPEIAAARLQGPFGTGTKVKIRFRTGPRLTFTLVEVVENEAFTDEAKLPGARIAHRHVIEPLDDGVRLVNTISIEGPLYRVWAGLMGGRAARALPEAQRRIADMASA